MKTTRLARLLLAGFACLLIAGCAKQGTAPVYPVHGQVLLNGKPLADAIVSFHAQNGNDKEAFPTAHTDGDGRFSHTTYSNGDGAPEGSYAISLVCFRPRGARNGGGRTENVVPQRYANPTSSGLNATVVPGDNELQPLKVKAY
jgi:hypothetical protein